MIEILKFYSGLLPLIEEEYNYSDPDKIGEKTSKYILEHVNQSDSIEEDRI